MPRDHLEGEYFSADILEFIKLLHIHKVRYVVVGGEAVIYYGHARLTGDIDFFYESGRENATALFQALLVFWGGEIPGMSGSKNCKRRVSSSNLDVHQTGSTCSTALMGCPLRRPGAPGPR
jgi:hypothetical protein